MHLPPFWQGLESHGDPETETYHRARWLKYCLAKTVFIIDKLMGHSIIKQSKFSNFVTHPLRFFFILGYMKAIKK